MRPWFLDGSELPGEVRRSLSQLHLQMPPFVKQLTAAFPNFRVAWAAADFGSVEIVAAAFRLVREAEEEGGDGSQRVRL